MITGEVRHKIDKIWSDIWAGGITNPLTVIEQLTYLMFIRSLDEKELVTEQLKSISPSSNISYIFPQTPEGQELRWSNFKHRDSETIFQIIDKKVFPFIKAIGTQENESSQTAFSKYMQDATFQFPTPQVLEMVVTALDDLYITDLSGQDMQGDLYEYMLSKLSTAGQNGQFRTPKHIREMMVKLVNPTQKDTICDPACGTAGFLVSSAEHVRSQYGTTMNGDDWKHFEGPMFAGMDTDNTMLRLSAMNLMLHSIDTPNIKYYDSVSKDNESSGEYDVILANPPFTGSINKSSIHPNLTAVTNTTKTELLFLALFLRMLKKGGRCACIVPDGVLFGSSNAHKNLRQELVEKHYLQGVISMPSGVFKPYAGVSTAVLLFTKTGSGGTDKVWFYDMQTDGFTLDDKRSPSKEDDIPDIVARFAALEQENDRKRTDKSFFVPKSEIVEQGYDLSINRYKEMVYEKIDHDPPHEIMGRIQKLNKEIASSMDELRGMLDE